MTAAKPWRNLLVAALAFFVVSRALMLTAFPIFNDEAIYLQYAQRIHDDFAHQKFISMNNDYRDWKPPLQFWLAAPLIRWGDPLLVGRAVAALVSFAGFFGFYLFTRELFGPREATLTACFYALCPPVLFHNDEFIAETFLFSIAPFVYWALLKAMRPNEWRWLWTVVAIAFGAALLLFKQSGFLLLALAIFLPLAKPRELAVNLAIAATVIAGAWLMSNAILPHEFDTVRDRFNGRWTMSATEVFALPFDIWRTNLRLVGYYVGTYYSWLVPLFAAVFCGLALRRKNFPELTLSAMLVTSAFAICFLLRGFNEYMFNTAIVAVLLPILARCAMLVWDLAPSVRARFSFLALAAVVLLFWTYQIALMRFSPSRYFERSTPWAIANYLRGWPTGFGVKQAVALLENEKRPGVILADAQWSNPRVALEVYRDRFPNFKIVPVLRAFPQPNELSKIVESARRTFPARFAVFSADPSGPRQLWEPEAERMFSDCTKIEAAPGQMPIVVCRF